MKIRAVEFLHSHISEDHRHELSFVKTPASLTEPAVREDRLDVTNSFYIGFEGDPIIIYESNYLSEEIERIKSLSIVKNVESIHDVVKVYLDFDVPHNVLVACSNQWIVPNVEYQLLTNQRTPTVSRVVYDPEESTVVSAKYVTLTDSIEYDTSNKLIVISDNKLSINGQEYDRCMQEVEGPITLSTTEKTHVFVLEYTD